MSTQAVYAVHFPPRRPWAARLYRFRSPGVRGFRMERKPRRWRAPREAAALALAAVGDREKRWRYEGPGVWSMPVGALRGVWWRLRA